ncbi:MAG: iron ABC transporter permease [Alphaproteobacteria bacterium]
MSHIATAPSGEGVYRSIVRRKTLLLGSMTALLLLCLLLDIALGPARLPLWEVIQAVVAPGSVAAASKVIVWEIRLPVALMAVAVGAALAIAGAEMQTILNNPLASPFTLGISAAAGFGAALAIVLGVGVLPLAGVALIPANAFLFAMLAALLIYFASQLRGVTIETVVLLGIALVFTFNALLALLQYIATEQALQEVVFWTLGSLTKATWGKVGVAFATIFTVTPFLVISVWPLTALRLGDEKARSLGINVRALRLRVLVLVSLLASVAVAFVGTIGFVGLVGPHIARMLVGEDQRFFLPVAALAGAIMMSATSIVSKELIPGVIFPIGIITALVGIPFFLSLIFARRRESWG